jgi:hypothetical protein
MAETLHYGRHQICRRCCGVQGDDVLRVQIHGRCQLTFLKVIKLRSGIRNVLLAAPTVRDPLHRYCAWTAADEEVDCGTTVVSQDPRLLPRLRAEEAAVEND